MAKMQIPATGFGGGDREVDQAGERVDRENSPSILDLQYQLVAAVKKNARSRYEVGVRHYSDGAVRIVLRIRDQNGSGGWREAGPCVALAPDKLPEIIAGLMQALDLIPIALDETRERRARDERASYDAALYR